MNLTTIDIDLIPISDIPEAAKKRTLSDLLLDAKRDGKAIALPAADPKTASMRCNAFRRARRLGFRIKTRTVGGIVYLIPVER